MGTSSVKHSRLNKNFQKKLSNYIQKNVITSDNALSTLSIVATIVTGNDLISACVVGTAKGLMEGHKEYSKNNDIAEAVSVGVKEGMKEAGKELVFGTVIGGFVDIVGFPDSMKMGDTEVSREARIIVEEGIARGLETTYEKIKDGGA